MKRAVRLFSSVVLGLVLVLGGLRPAAAEQTGAGATNERPALVTFVDRSLKRAPSGAPGEAYAGAGDYHSTAWGRRIASELGQRHRLQTVSQRPVLSLGVHCVVYAIGDARSWQAVTAELRKEKIVSGVYPMQDFHTLAADPYGPLQSAVVDMQLDQAHLFSTRRNVIVAMVDAAVDFDHPDLSGQISSHRDLVDDHGDLIRNAAHGTAVAGVIAARAGNAAGIVGVAPGVHLTALRACWSSAPEALDAVCNTLTLAKTIDTAIRCKVRTLNLSLSGPRDALLEALLQAALAQGMLVVGALPTAGATADVFPTAVPGVIGVGVAGQAASAVLAPGTDVFTTLPYQRYGYMSGSSIAAAHITGVVALLLEVSPTLSVAEITALLTEHDALDGSLTRTVNACSVGAAPS